MNCFNTCTYNCFRVAIQSLFILSLKEKLISQFPGITHGRCTAYNLATL